MWLWMGGDGVIKTSGESGAWVDKLLNHDFALLSLEFSSTALVDALVDGPFDELTQSDAFVRTLNKRIARMCQHSLAGDDVVDVQPVIRALTFDVVCGELSEVLCVDMIRLLI